MSFQKLYKGVRVVDSPSPDNVRRLDLNVIPAVVRMQSNGLLIDKEHLRQFSLYLGGEMERYTDEVHRLTGHRINIASGDQIAALLFKKVGIVPPKHLKLTKSGKRLTVDDEALSSIKHLHPCIPVIQSFTECHKLKNTYADVLPILAKEDGRVHTSLRVTRQVSGRISSSEPNLMAQPTRTDLGKRIRRGFIAGKGKKLGTIDQSQIEMRIAAHRSGCLSMIDTFLREGDIHVETATRIFFSDLPIKLGRMPNREEAELAGMDAMQHRYPAKRIGFGVLFGITPQGLQDQILIADDDKWTDIDRQAFKDKWTVKLCEKTIADWFAVYWEIANYLLQEHSKARRFGYAWDMFGRIRWIPEVKSIFKHIQEEGLRYCNNFAIQASATGTMKLFITECFDKLIEGKYKGVVEPLLAIHDEFLVEGEEGAIEDFLYDAGKIMEEVIVLDVPIRFSTAYGDNWGALVK